MQQQIPEGTLIVVADGGSARVFTNIGSGHTLQLKQQDALKLQDISAQGVSGQGPSGSMPQDTSIAQMNEATFAKQLAGQLNEDALNNRYAHLVRIADPQTLGRIRPQLHKEVQARFAEGNFYIPIAKGAADNMTNPFKVQIAQNIGNAHWHANFFDQALGPAVGGVVNDVSAELAANAMSAEEAAQLVQEALEDSL